VAAAAAVVTVGLNGPPTGDGQPGGGSPVQASSPQQIVLSAAHTTAAVDRMGADVTVTDQGRTTVTATGEFDGANAVVHETDAAGTRTSVVHDRDDDALAPFATSAADVVEAAVTEGGAAEIGTDDVRGVSAVHYRLVLDEHDRTALQALGARELAWFYLEDPRLASSVDVWVADGLIQRIDVLPDRRSSTAWPARRHPLPVAPQLCRLGAPSSRRHPWAR
jgi:hypothetical protein